MPLVVIDHIKVGGIKVAKAIWNGETLAESTEYKEVEGNIYFPPESVKWEYF